MGIGFDSNLLPITFPSRTVYGEYHISFFRDFVSVRRFQKEDNIMILAGKSTFYEAVKERKGIVR